MPRVIMWTIRGCILVICLLLADVKTQVNLYETIRNNVNTTKFADLLDNAGMKAMVEQSACTGGAQCLTVFAPNNAAIDWLVQASSWQNLAMVQKMKIINDHIIPATKPLTTTELLQYGTALNLINVGFGQGRRIDFALSTDRYAFQTQVTQDPRYYINNALLVTPNLAATNGMVHVVNQALYTPNYYVPFDEYLLKQPDLKKSAELWMKLASNGQHSWIFYPQNQQDNYFATFFIVTDDGWAKVPQKQMDMLLTNSSLLTEVLSYQYYPNQLVYPEWTSEQPQINIYSGFPPNPSAPDMTQLRRALLTRSQKGEVFLASGHTMAQVALTGQEIRRAIVHKVSSAIGYIYETRDEVVKRFNPNLLIACQADSECNSRLNSNERLTFFVPTDVNWPRFAELTASQKTTILKYMVITGIIDREQMTKTFGIQIDALPYAMRFRMEAEALYVESRLPGQGYVSTRLITANQAATNGIVHIIDGIPGLAYQTVEQYLAQTPIYSKFSSYAFVQKQFKGGPYIFLAPTNDALQSMENDGAVGAKLLMNEDSRNYIFRRHTFPLIKPFEYLSPVQYLVPTANAAFTREQLLMDILVPNSGRVMVFTYSGVSTDVRSNTGGYQFTNGILYRLNKLIYMESDLTRNMCSSPGCP